MRRDRCSYLADIDQAVDAIQMFVAGKTFDHFEATLETRLAVERAFEIIGEALRQCTDDFPGSTATIPDLREIIATRNVLAHGYFAVNPYIIWNSITEDLPALQAEVKRLIAATCP